MDAFFASVELLRHPEYRTEPLIVGGTGNRGVVAAASYVARSYGIHSAMSTAQATRLCPHLVALPGDHGHYQDVSRRVMSLFHDVTPLVEPLSLDEAFLDVRGAAKDLDATVELAQRLRQRVLDEEGLTCSIGVAASKFVAKLATDSAKPTPSRDGPQFGRGVFVVEPGREIEFLHPMAVRRLWGVGPATAARLDRMGIETVADLAAQPLNRLVSTIGQASGRHLHRLSNGIDDRPVVVGQPTKSISHEETFASDVSDRSVLHRELVKMVDAVATRLHKAGLVGRTITVKVTFSDFSQITRSVTLKEPTARANLIRQRAAQLLDNIDDDRAVRLLGAGVSQLEELQAEQLTLDMDSQGALNRADDVVEAIRDRFGDSAIGPAALADPDTGLNRMVPGQQQWGPNQAD